MAELNTDYHHPFCNCCGVKSTEIFAKLQSSKPVRKYPGGNSDRVEHRFEGHSMEVGANRFDEGDTVRFCAFCGESLDEDDIHSRDEVVGERGYTNTFLVYYHCSECGEEEYFE